MLMTQSAVSAMVVCPVTARPLVQHDGYAVPEQDETDLDIVYPIVDGLPVLIVAGRSVVDVASVSSRSDLGLVDRSKLSGWLRSFAASVRFGGNEVSGQNIAQLAADLREVKDRPVVLVVGGGSIGAGCEILYESTDIDVVAFDIYPSEHVQFIADGHDIPLPPGSVDAVVIQAVLEHVLDPSRVVDELHRVLAVDGFVYAETPFLQQVHEGPYDFSRFTESGHRNLFRRFLVRKSGVCGGPGTQMLWSLEHLTRGLTRSIMMGRAVRVVFSWVRLFDRLVPEDFAVDSAAGFYFYGQRATTAATPIDVIGHYKGAQLLRSSHDDAVAE